MVDWLLRLFSSPKKPPARPVVAPAVAKPKAPAPAAPQEEAPQPVSAKAPALSWMQRSDINSNFTNWLFEADGDSNIFTSKIETDILAALEEIVKSKQSGANLVRRMPGVIPQLLKTLRDENFSGTQLARTISHDVVLIGAVIRLANSSYYNPAQPISSIEHAVLVLGQGGLRQLITGVAFKPIIDLKSGHFTKSIATRIWEQSEKCAVAGRMLALGERVDPFEAFLAGLIQNVGLIAALSIMDQLSDGTQSVGSEGFCNGLMLLTRTLSCSIGREWHFPETVIRAIEEQSAGNKATMSPIGKILSMSDYLSKTQILIANDRLNANDARLTKGLTEAEINCLKELGDVQESEAEPEES